MIAPSPIDILRRAAAVETGADCILVTLVGIEGTASRALGAQMVVMADGTSLGSFSGGCIEAAVVAEAMAALAEGKGRTVRYGIGSPYIDVRLPCGGGIDLCFTPRPDGAVLRAALADLDARREARVVVSEHGVASEGDGFALTVAPVMRVVAVGQGDDLAAFARLAVLYGLDVLALSPERDRLGELAGCGAAVQPIVTRTALPPFATDPWTGIVFLFHDHDWEEALLPPALALPAFYIGAVGSHRTHQRRLAMLADAGVPADQVARLKGRIGLIPSTRDPATLALSVLSEVVGAFQNRAATATPALDVSPQGSTRT